MSTINIFVQGKALEKILLILLTFSFWALGNPLPKSTKQMINQKLGLNENLKSSNFEKLNKYHNEIVMRRLEVEELLRTHLRENDNLTPEEIEEEVADEKLLKAYHLLNEMLQKAMNDLVDYKAGKIEVDEEKMYHTLQRALELDYACKTSGIGLAQNEIVQYLREFFEDHKIVKHNPVSAEATNLWNAKKERPYTHQELEEFINAGGDISKLDPTPNNPFWYPLDLKNRNINRHFNRGKDIMYDDVSVYFPEKRAKFKKVKKSQTKPKFHVTVKHNGKKYKYKLKLAEEIQSEVTASALSSALGFHSDLSQYVKDFEVVLPKKLKLKELKEEFNSYYSKYDFDKLIKEVKEEDNKTVVVIKEALLELIPKELMRVGPWAYGELDHKNFREIRGLYIFNTWIANNDIKEADNNKLVLKLNDDKSFKMFQFQHDQGFSFGNVGKEKIQEFKWDLIKRSGPEYAIVNNNNFQENSGFDQVTYQDARWMIRKIAKLTREQIADAVRLGGWPTEVAILLTEKLINRRNQLVTGFDLQDEIDEIPCDRNIETSNGVVQDGNLTEYSFEEYIRNYGGEFYELMLPIYDSAKYYAAQSAIALTSSFDTFVLDSQEMGYDSKILGQVQFTINREIRENERKQEVDDNFIVQDRVRIRFSLGVGMVLRGKVSYYKDYRLIYTKKTRSEATFNNGFIFNALLPFHMRKNKLPDDYVLIVEDGFEGEGELFLSSTKIPISASVSKGVGVMSRTLYHRHNKDYTVFRDRAHFNSWHAALYANLYLLRIPVFQADWYSGNLNRQIYQVSFNENKNSEKKQAFEHLLMTGDLRPLSEVAKTSELNTNYVSRRGFFDLFGIIRNDSRYREDKIIYEDEDSIATENFYQLNLEQIKQWRWFENGENKNRRLHLLGNMDDEENILDIDLRISFDIEDRNTRMSELKNHYIPLANRLALNKRFIPFSPELHSTNDTWGNMHVSVDLGYPKAALDKMLEIKPEDFYRVMAQSSNRDENFWSGKTREDVDRTSSRLRRRVKLFLRDIEKANKKEKDTEKYKKLTQALKDLIWKQADAYNTSLLERVNYLIGADNYFIESRLSMPDYTEMRLPADVPLYNIRNRELYKDHLRFDFEYYRMREVWYMFQDN